MIGEKIFNNLKEKYKTGEEFSILFCPYKESMWDSMATVYHSALEDEDTRTGIMPIPYFVLKDLAPSEIKQEFPLANEFPEILNDGWDVIVIHYPYDSRNRITRPLLTSYMLKYFCKHLVFIHYAVPTDEYLSDEQVILPAIVNADLCIYSDDNYARQAKKILVNHGVKNEVVGWGSPKFDRLTQKFPVPREWEDKMKGKRVILFQTSIIPYMQDANKLMQISRILDKLLESGQCIWWRPHPLYEETILTYRPLEIKKFRELKEKVAENNIVDETSELHRAIAMTDELISDKSSVVTLYKATGKPITMMEEL